MLGTLLALAALPGPFARPELPAAPPGWQTTYETSGFLDTGRYQEAVDYVRRLAKASPYARVVSFGVSPEGRPMVALAMSKDGAFSPEAARRSKKPLVVINNGIHSGEIEGKDADLILAREILVTKKEEALLDGANLLLIPIFSVDAHERFGPYHRINQNGPREMGWRANANNLNLNRDWIKADAGEMRAMLRLLRDWQPDFLFDNHTTDGGDWQYPIQIGVPTAPTQDPGVAAWSRKMIETVQPRVEADGFLVAPYFDLGNPGKPEQGISVDDSSPRFSTGYMAARNRPAMLIETHMLKPYKVRVEATYSMNRRVIAHIGATGAELKAANRAADEAGERTKPGDTFTLSARLTDAARPFTFRGYAYTPYKSEVSGASTHAWNRNRPLDTPTTLRDTFAPGLTVAAPAAYAVPPQWKEAAALLDLHGIRYTRLKAPLTSEFATHRFEGVGFPPVSFEGRFQPRFRAVAINETRTLPAGTLIVSTAQPNAKLALHLLEPEAPDSLLRWGFFNAVFETKEYFEEYSMEPIARRMLDSDPKLKTEFEARLKEPQFAASPRARLEFFYTRSPFYDARLNKYPVVRLTADQLRAAR